MNNRRSLLAISTIVLLLFGFSWSKKNNSSGVQGLSSITVDTSQVMSVKVHFKDSVTALNVAKSVLKYNKNFAYSLTLDDGQEDAYTYAYRLLKGGYNSDNLTTYPGLYYTDGCGNSIPFKAGIAWPSVNTIYVDNHNGTAGAMTWTELKELYANGWDLLNHSYSHHWGTGTNYQYEVSQNTGYVKLKTNYDMTQFVIPTGDTNYTQIAFNNGMKAVYNQSKDFPGSNGLKVDDNIDLNRFKFYRRFISNTGSNTTNIANFIQTISSRSDAGNHYWFNEFTHNVTTTGSTGLTFDTFEYYMKYIEKTYGKSGSDRVWMAPLQEVYEYLLVREKMKVTYTLSKNVLDIKFDFSDVPKDLRKYALTLLINSNQDFTTVDFPANTTASFKGTGSVKLLNLTWSKHPSYKEPVYTCTAAGTISRDYWANVTGTTISTIPLSSPPTSTSLLTIFEGPVNVADNYASRIRGYLCPPMTGYYTFWISSDNVGELYLGTGDDPSTRVKIAYNNGASGYRDWTRYPTQQVSSTFYLQKGKRYYIEALQKESTNSDHLSVGWQLPDGTLERPIPATRISPYTTQGANIPPSVAINAPSNNQEFVAPGTINIDATASDPDGFISKVEFYRDNVKLGEDLSAPYDYDWTNVPAGNYSLTVKATDNFNATTTSIPVAIKVNTPTANILPTASISSPISNQEFFSPANIVIKANATDSDGSVVKVEFYKDLVKLGEVASAPFDFNWLNVSTGNYSLTVKAYDNRNGITTSSAIAIKVTTPNSSNCQMAGNIQREYWTNITGREVSSIPVSKAPNGVETITIFEGPVNWADNYGTRIRGYICAPQTGNYYFWIASNDKSELWLSTDSNPLNKSLIAYVSNYTNYREWTKLAGQQSVAIYLEAGKKYYIEALHKEGLDSDHISVGWQLPDNTLERPIPGLRLSPYSTSLKESSGGTYENTSEEKKYSINLFPNPIEKGLLTISIEGYTEDTEALISVKEINGNKLYSKEVSCKSNCSRTMIDLEERFPNGIYIVSVTINNKVYSEKLLIK